MRTYSVVEIRKQFVSERDAGLWVRHIDQMRKLAITIDTRERIMLPLGLHGKLGILQLHGQYIGRCAPRGIVVGRAALRLPDRLLRPCLMDHLGDADAIVGEHRFPPDLLNAVMFAVNPPGRQRGFVLPDLVRQQEIVARQNSGSDR